MLDDREGRDRSLLYTRPIGTTARLIRSNPPTNGSIASETMRETQGNSLFRPSPRSLMPQAEPTTYTIMAAPLGVNKAVSRSMFRKKETTKATTHNPDKKAQAVAGAPVLPCIPPNRPAKPP